MKHTILRFQALQSAYESAVGLAETIQANYSRVFESTGFEREHTRLRSIQLYRNIVDGRNTYRLIGPVCDRGRSTDAHPFGLVAILDLTPVLHRFDHESVDTAFHRLLQMQEAFTCARVNHSDLINRFPLMDLQHVNAVCMLFYGNDLVLEIFL